MPHVSIRPEKIFYICYVFSQWEKCYTNYTEVASPWTSIHVKKYSYQETHFGHSSSIVNIFTLEWSKMNLKPPKITSISTCCSKVCSGKKQKIHHNALLTFCERNPPPTGRLSTLSASDTESVSKAWRHQVMWTSSDELMNMAETDLSIRCWYPRRHFPSLIRHTYHEGFISS